MNATTVTETRRVVYDDGSVRGFLWASVIWGAIGLLVGLTIALQLTFPVLGEDTPWPQWLTFGRLRPLHTNAVIFALVGNMMFAGIYYSTQRLLKARMASDLLTKIHLWGWQLVILGAALTLPLGITQSKEYAELEWPLDVLVVIVWVAFAINFFWTLAIRNEKNLYVAIWFYISTILTIAVLYIVNNLALPVTATKSYGIFSGAQDALTQWWYGHNAVAFFLTTPILGIMYYFLPKAANRPVFSYRLSIIHFWALVFIYIWAGPHHLLNTALPDWAQSLGMLFSLMLWAPSWGGMLNGLLTLRGAWDKVRTDPVLKFFVAGVTFYGMSTFEGPLLAIKEVNALGHYTDWIIGHVHSGALGWNGLMAAGMFYWLTPRLFGTKLYSSKLADYHFWLAMVGILLYISSMWVSGIGQGLMWRAMTLDGALQYPDWNEIIGNMQPMYLTRSLGGLLFVSGWVMMVVNLVKTARAGKATTVEVEVSVTRPITDASVPGAAKLILSRPVIVSVLGMGAATVFAISSSVGVAVVGFVLLGAVIVFVGGMLAKSTAKGQHTWHEQIESRPLAFTVLTLLAVLAGGIYELVPGLVIEKKVPYAADGSMAVEPYKPLELVGRDIYVREGCYVCHSQMVRPFLGETMRFAQAEEKFIQGPSLLEESLWDHPFQWGSKRTGPDLARVGTKYSATWHYQHMFNPRDVSQNSIMPSFPWLYSNVADSAVAGDKMRALKALGVPYVDDVDDDKPEHYWLNAAYAAELYKEQADEIVAALHKDGMDDAAADREIIALTAFLLRLGRNFPIDPEMTATKNAGEGN